MKRTLALAGYLAVLVLGWHWTYSTSGWVVLGLGSVLLLDRYGLRLLPWREPVDRIRGLGIRVGYVAAGAVASYSICRGAIRLQEALYLGVVFSLSALLLECALAWATGLGAGEGDAARRSKVRLVGGAALLCLGSIVLSPLLALHSPRSAPTRTPLALGMAYEEVRFRTADGLELFGWLIPAPEHRGAVIFCHGHGGNRSHVTFYLYLPLLHEQGLDVLAFDFRGHGDSPGHTVTFGHREVEDVVAAQHFVRDRFPESPIFLVGISYGASVALQALPRLSGVEGVWVDAPFARLSNVVEQKFSEFPAPLRRPLITLYYVVAWLDCGFWGPDVNPIEHLEDASAPIHFCHGSEDGLVPFTDGQALYEAYPGPKECFWVEGATHFDLLKVGGAEFVDRFRRFFSARLGDVVSSGR